MRVQIAPRWTVFQPDEVAVADEFNGIGAVPKGYRLVELFHEPPIVSVFVRVSGHLLLFGSDAGRIQVHVRVQVTAAGHAVLQSQKRTVSDLCNARLN